MAVLCLKHGALKSHFCRLSELPVTLATVASGDIGDIRTLGELGEDDELFLFSTKKALTFRRRGLRCAVSLMIAEPRAVQKSFYRLIGYFGARFRRILTHSRCVLDTCPNAEKWIHGGAWVDPQTAHLGQKTGLVSIIASKKRDTEGQCLRHALVDWARGEGIALDAFGWGYRPLENKADGHAPYRYSVVIENSRSPGYFTEKLIDALLCASVPIYWGDPDVSDYFDPRGMILCESFDDLKQALLRVHAGGDDVADAAVERNRLRALETLTMPNSMARISGVSVFRKQTGGGRR